MGSIFNDCLGGLIWVGKLSLLGILLLHCVLETGLVCIKSHWERILLTHIKRYSNSLHSF